MRIRYETGMATLVQFVAGSAISFISGVLSVIASCRASSSVDCLTNVFVSLVLLLLTVFILATILVLGYIAQARRSPRLAVALISVECIAAVIFAYNIKHALNWWDTLSSLLSLALAIFVIVVAARLFAAKGGRVVKLKPRHVKFKQ